MLQGPFCTAYSRVWKLYTSRHVINWACLINTTTHCFSLARAINFFLSMFLSSLACPPRSYCLVNDKADGIVIMPDRNLELPTLCLHRYSLSTMGPHLHSAGRGAPSTSSSDDVCAHSSRGEAFCSPPDH